MRSPLGSTLHTLRYALPILVLLTACSKGDKVPSYLNIPAIGLTTGQLEGANTIRATDAWVYANDELLGVWELPARVPALYSGDTRITVATGIKRNGMYDDRLRYPFYTRWEGNVDLVPGSASDLQPVVNYIPQTNFWIEDFDDVGTLLNVTTGSDTVLLRFTPQQHPDIVLDGSACGGVILDADHRFIRLFTDVNFEVTGGPVFLELDYRNDIQFTVGMVYQLSGMPIVAPFVYVAPTKRPDGQMPWNKIYIDLSPVWNQGGVSLRNFYLEVSLPSDRNAAEVYFDNLKVLRVTP